MKYKRNLSVVVLVTVIVISSGLICQFPHCDTVKCDPVPKNCTGTIRMGGGYCGCCEACFTYIDEGEYCEVKDVVDAIIHPLTENCGSGLYCDNNSSTCQVMPNPAIG